MSLELDPRQRAMLREMGVHVWQPRALAGPDNPAEPEIAIKKVAAGANSARAEPRFDVEKSANEPLPAPAGAPRTPLLLARVPGVEQMDWLALQAAVSGCQACGLCHSRTHTVFGVGPIPSGAAAPGVDWLVVGEAPGENEDLTGEPFVGPAGQLLDNMLLAVGLQRATGHAAPRAGVSSRVFITNVLKCRPPGNRNPDAAEIAQCEPYLKRQIELLQPRMILALGKFAAQVLLQDSLPDVQKTPLGKLRGQVHRYLGVPVVVSYHPAYLLRSLPDKAKAWDDLCLGNQLAPTVARFA